MAPTETVTVVREAVRGAVVGYIVVIMTRSMAVSSVMAMRSIVAVAIVVDRVVAVMVGSYAITSLTHHRMAFPLLSKHHVL